ncbi:MAG: oligosaccharide flippase family protein [Candidatus Marinimicrobia bacterium]|nr:oligosaccharide flippase family protein [Candidatus Neomarinimicrobiota bacterium]
MATRNKSFLQDSSIYFSAIIISTAIAFLTLPIYTRYLSPADYGIVALYMMFGQISSGLVSIGIHSASYRYYFKYKDDPVEYKILNSTNLLFLFIVYTLVGIGVYYLASWFSSNLFNGKITDALIILSFINGCINYFINYTTLILTAQLRSVTFSTIIISQALLRVALALYFIFMYSMTYLALIYATIFTNIIIVVLLLFLIRQTLGIRFSLSSLRKSLLFSYPTTPIKVVGLVYSSFDKIMLNKYTGLISVGYYIFGQKFGNMLKMVMDSIGKVWTPFFMENAYLNTKKAQNIIVNRFYELAFFYMTIGLGIIYFSEEMIKILTTKEYYPSMYVVPIYVYFYFFSIMGTITVPQLMFAEKMIYRLPISVVSVIVNIVLNVLLIPSFGAIGAAVATTLSQLMVGIIGLYLSQRVFPLPINKLKLIRLYLILLIFTIPVYPIMALGINFLLKVVIKLSIILLFIWVGVKIKHITFKYFSDTFFHLFGRRLSLT